MATLRARLARLERTDRAASRRRPGSDYSAYRHDPVGFARDVLKVDPTPDQRAILAKVDAGERVKVPAGHSVGKTFVAAVACVWWHYTRNPGVVITTAPTQRDVVDLLWTEVRLLVRRAGLPPRFVGPAAPEMREHEDHWAKGYTAAKGESFQGRHRPHMLFVFDEDEGLDAAYWKTLNTMYIPGGEHACLAIGNPTTTTSQSYAEEQMVGLDGGDPKWSLYPLSCLNHPNVRAELAGLPPPIPDAVRLAQVDGWVAEWCEPAGRGDGRPGDIEWRPGSGKWYRPGPDFQSRVLGRRPLTGVDSVWSEAAFDAACWLDPLTRTVPNAGVILDADVSAVGVDVARYGTDWTCLHGRTGRVSERHEGGQGWPVTTTAQRAMDMAAAMAADRTAALPRGAARVRPEDVSIRVDDAGVGGGVTDILVERGWAVVPVNAGTRPVRADRYPLRRDELWFDLAARPPAFGRLDRKVIARLRQQALAPRYEVTADKRRRVESKDQLKKRGVRSPDDMDAVNLAYAEFGGAGGATLVGTTHEDRRR